MANSFLGLSLPQGELGTISREFTGQIVETVAIDDDSAVNFGSFVKMDGGIAEAVATGDTAADIYGVLVRDWPVNLTTTNEPAPTNLQAVLRSGYILVKCSDATSTATQGDPVYLKLSDGTITQTKPANTDTTTIAIGATFMGPAKDGVAEIAFNI